MSEPVAVAVYARISSDPTGGRLGVDRQLEDCRKLARQRNWRIAEEYVDNDISAYSGTSRPEYLRMLDDIDSGIRDAVIVYNMDRLTRRPRELEALIDLFDRKGLSQLVTASGDFDLGNDQGLFLARLMSAVSAQESGRKSARLRRKMQERAENGLPGTSGGRRAYGWQQDKTTLIASEADTIRQLVSRYIAGESTGSLAQWLNNEGLPTVTGREWGIASVRTMLSNPRLAGHRVHRGAVVARGIWEPIITDLQHDQVKALMATRTQNQVRSPRRALLSRLLRCGLCGSTLFTGTQNGSRRYVCVGGPGRSGCARLSIKAEPVETAIVEAVLARLDSAQFADSLTGRARASEALSEVSSSLALDRAQMEELAQLWSARQISSAEWKAAREPIEARIKTADRLLASATGTQAVAGLAGQGAAVRDQWSGLSLSRQHAIVSTMIDTITINAAASQGSRDFLSRISPNWRL